LLHRESDYEQTAFSVALGKNDTKLTSTITNYLIRALRVDQVVFDKVCAEY
jgi:hypothetical protein